MSEVDGDAILIATDFGPEVRPNLTERGLNQIITQATLKSVPVHVLKNNIGRFFDQLSEILTSRSDAIGDFEISEVTVTAQINADGQVSLMGSGTKIGLQGGFSFVLKRMSKLK